MQHNALKYRGYFHDADLGFYYLGSCFYAPAICRFVNADTTDVLMADPCSLTDKNLYSYCDNNPVMRTDDDGDFWNIAAGVVIGGVISAGVEFGTQLLTTGKVDLIGIGIAAAGGAFSGALASTGVRLIGQVIGNAGISGISEAASQWKDGNRDIVSIVKNAGVMALVGGISGVIGGPGIKAKGTAYKKSLDTLSSLKNNISKALSNPKGYRHQINSAIKKHISVSRTAVKNTTKSFTVATIYGNIVGKFKSWLSR